MSEVTVSTFLFNCVFHRIELALALLFNCLLPPGNQNWSRFGRPRLVCGFRSSQCLRPHILAVWTCCLQVRGRNLGSPVRKPSRSWILQELWIICHFLTSKSSYWIFICLSVTCGLLGTGTPVDVSHVSADGVPFIAVQQTDRAQSSTPPPPSQPHSSPWASFASVMQQPWGEEAHLTAFCSVPLFCFLCLSHFFPLLWSSSAGSWVSLPLTPRPHSRLSSAKVDMVWECELTTCPFPLYSVGHSCSQIPALWFICCFPHCHHTLHVVVTVCSAVPGTQSVTNGGLLSEWASRAQLPCDTEMGRGSLQTIGGFGKRNPDFVEEIFLAEWWGPKEGYKPCCN